MQHNELITKWTERATLFRDLGAHIDAAALCDQFVADLHAEQNDSSSELLTLDQAAHESGYGKSQLLRLARGGKLHASGAGRHWRIARGDLPRKLSAVAGRRPTLHLPGAKAEQVVRDSVGTSNGTPR